MDLLITNTLIFASQDITWWTGVVWITCGLLWCFYLLFGLSYWRHPFIAEDPFVSKLIYILDSVRMSTFSSIFNFWVNCSFNWKNTRIYTRWNPTPIMISVSKFRMAYYFSENIACSMYTVYSILLWTSAFMLPKYTTTWNHMDHCSP